MNRPLPNASARLADEKKPLKVVLIPCIACALFIICVSVENLLWRTASYYPAALARVRVCQRRVAADVSCRQGNMQYSTDAA